MTLDTRKTALALGLGMALAACGGSQDGAPGPQSSAPGTKGSAQETGHALATKAPDDSPPIRKDPGQGVHIRGDLLIQALLSQVGQRDGKGQPYLDWLDPETKSYGQVGEPQSEEPLFGPVVLVNEDIQPAAPEDSALGKYVYQVGLSQGPMRGAAQDRTTKNRANAPIDISEARFGVSLPGLPKKGEAADAAITSPLEISRELQLSFREAPDERDDAPPVTHQLRLTASAATTLQPNEYYVLSGGNAWNHEWRVQEADFRKHGTVALEISQPQGQTEQFQTCVNFSKSYEYDQRLCDLWEVPAGWTSGQPLRHLGQTLHESFFSELGSSTLHWHWSDRKGTPPIAPDSLKTTSEPVNAHGISGAVLAAMFDAFTPRAKGMRALPARATATDGLLGTTALKHDPQYVSLHHDSRATTYADGGTADAASHSPATGSYLYAFRSGAWTAPTQSRVAVRGVDQNTMALHVSNDPQKGFTLPRWTGLNAYSVNFDNKQYWLYQGEQVGEGNAAMTIAPNDLLMFGKIVQSWHDPQQFSEEKTQDAMVTLSVEQSQLDPRSADMCWTSRVQAATASKSCTTWQIPQGWQPGQPLKPQAYYVYTNDGYKPQYWSTRVAGN